MIYESICEKCKKQHEYSASMSLPVEDIRAAAPDCCGQKTTKLISLSQIGAMSFGLEKKVTLTDGTVLHSGSEYKNYMKNNNKLSEADAISQAKHVRKEKDKKWKEDLHKTVVDTYDKLKAGKAA